MRSDLLFLSLISVALLGCGEKNATSLMDSAKVYIAKDQLDAAAVELRAAIQQDSASSEARALFGKLLLDSGNAGGAAIELRKALELGHAEVTVVPLLARALLEMRQFKSLVDEFGSRSLPDPPAQADLSTTIAKAYMALGQLPQAESALAQAMTAQPQFAAADIARVRLLAQRGDIEGAVSSSKEVVARHAGVSEAWRVHGDVLLLLKANQGAAFDAYRKAIQLDDRNVAARVGAVNILLNRADVESVDRELAALRQVAPNHPQTRFFEAQLAFRRGDFQRTDQLLQNVVKLAPDDARVLRLAGATALELGNLAQADATLRKALQLSPGVEDVISRQLLGRLYIKSGRAAKAIDVLEPLLSQPPDVETLAILAQAQALAGNDRAANELYAQILKIEPENVRSRTSLALADIKQGRAGKGFQELDAIARSDGGTTADLAQITAHLARREFAAALQAVDRLEKKAGSKALVENLRGRVQTLAGNLAEARRSFERALVIDSAYFPAVSGLAALDVKARQPELARQRFEALLKVEPGSLQALLALADLNERMKLPDAETLALLERAVKLAPLDAMVHVKLVEFLLRAKEPQPALAAAQNAASLVPEHSAVTALLGRAQSAAGDVNGAVKTFADLVALSPRSAEAHLRLAQAQIAVKRLDSARETLRRSIALSPDLLDAQRLLVWLEANTNRPDQALAVARTVQKQRPREAIGFVLEGDARDAQGNPTAALAAYRSAFDVAPSSETAVRLHAMLLKTGQTDEAARMAERWMKQRPADVLFGMNLANIALERGSFAEAEARYLEVLKVSPDNPLALTNIAWALAMQNKPGAVLHAEKAAALRSTDLSITTALIFALASESQLDRAIELQKALAARFPSDHLFRLNLARLYIQAKMKADAINELRSLDRLGEAFSAHAEVKRLLSSLQG